MILEEEEMKKFLIFRFTLIFLYKYSQRPIEKPHKNDGYEIYFNPSHSSHLC